MRTPDELKAMALVALAANFGKEFPEALLEMWLDLLSEHNADHVQEAVKAVIKKYKFKTIPPFAVLQEALDDISGTSEASLETQAVAEWGVLLRQMVDVGYYSQPKLHPTTAYVVGIMGGWQTACCWSESGMDFKRKEFIAFWKEAHGKVGAMSLGAGGVTASLNRGGSGAVHISSVAGLIPDESARQ